MKRLSLLLLIACQASLFAQNSDPKTLATSTDSVSYALGVNVGGSIKQNFEGMKAQNNVDLNQNLFIEGFIATLKGDPAALMNNEEALSLLQAFGTKLQADAQKKQADEAAQSKAEGDKFIAEMAKNKKVKKTESGLLYKIEKQTKGEKPLANSKVKVHYKGTLIDGTIFDSSLDRGEPLEIEVDKVIPGWTEGLQLMSPGSKYTFYIPSNLAYGERQMSEMIKPNSALVFEVELLEIMKPEAPSETEGVPAQTK